MACHKTQEMRHPEMYHTRNCRPTQKKENEKKSQNQLHEQLEQVD